MTWPLIGNLNQIFLNDIGGRNISPCNNFTVYDQGRQYPCRVLLQFIGVVDYLNLLINTMLFEHRLHPADHPAALAAFLWRAQQFYIGIFHNFICFFDITDITGICFIFAISCNRNILRMHQAKYPPQGTHRLSIAQGHHPDWLHP